MLKDNPLPFNKSDGLYIIAEIGSSHRGDRPRMREMVHAAAESGADCLKTQWIYAHEILPKNAGSIKLPNGELDIFQQFLNLELDQDFYWEMKDLSEELGMDWTASPFGPKSASEIISLDPPWIKVASPELNYFSLLIQLGESSIPLILSTGVSTLEDISESVKHIPHSEVGLMHCITSYPAPEEEYNLAVIPSFQRLFSLPSGLSDHSLSPIDLPLLASSVGAAFLEKHFTLDKNDGGMDDPIALDPKDFRRMTQTIRSFEGQTPSEKTSFLDQHIPPERQKTILGDGRKNVSPSESANYLRTNRSIHAIDEILPGTIINESNARVLRTEKNLRPGLHPRYWTKILGKKAIKRISYGEGIQFEDLSI
jgi:sialic acid synthase SpsE